MTIYSFISTILSYVFTVIILSLIHILSGLTEKGLLTGEEDGTFRPAASAARSEAAALLSRVKATMSAPEETAAPEKTAAPEATASAEPEATASAEPVATATAAPEATATPSK